MIFCYPYKNLFFRNAYACIWTECGQILFMVLPKLEDKRASRNFQLWYIEGSVCNTFFRLNAKATFREKNEILNMLQKNLFAICI